MSYPCRMTDPFLPIYDFDALEAEPDPIPAAPPNLYDYFAQKMDEAMYKALLDLPPAPKPFTFNRVNLGDIPVGGVKFFTTRPATALELAYDPHTLHYIVEDIK